MPDDDAPQPPGPAVIVGYLSATATLDVTPAADVSDGDGDG